MYDDNYWQNMKYEDPIQYEERRREREQQQYEEVLRREREQQQYEELRRQEYEQQKAYEAERRRRQEKSTIQSSRTLNSYSSYVEERHYVKTILAFIIGFVAGYSFISQSAIIGAITGCIIAAIADIETFKALLKYVTIVAIILVIISFLD